MTIYMTAKFEVKQEALGLCEQVIQGFVEDVRVSEPDTLFYTSLQEKENPTHFLHYFIFRDEQARELHSSSEAVNRFTSVLYPNLVAPVEFTEYRMFASTNKETPLA